MESIEAYIDTFLPYENPILKDEEIQGNSRRDIQPNIGRQTGTFLSWMIQLMKARQVLEFGTCIGYSTIFLAQALEKTDGFLTAVEFREDLYQETKRNLEAAGLSHRVTLIQGDANLVITQLTGPYDLILQDSDKKLYAPLIDRCIDLLRPGGVLAADDTLFPAKPEIPDQFKQPIQRYNEQIFADPRLSTTMLPLGDGLSISIKK